MAQKPICAESAVKPQANKQMRLFKQLVESSDV